MVHTDKHIIKPKRLISSIKRQARRASTSKYARSKKVRAGLAAVVLLAVFWALPTYAAKAPGQLGYGIKRGEEFLATNLAPLSSWRDQLRLDFADNRVIEAGYVADQANRNGSSNPTKTAATINGLLDSFESVYETRTSNLNQKLTDNKKISKTDATGFRKDAVGTYDELQLLRLQAPGGAQLAVLTSIDDIQQNIAALNDNLGVKPLSASDLSRLSSLVTIGVISKAQANQLSVVTSNRQLHTQLVNMIDNGQLPSDTTYQLDEDLIKQVEPENAKRFDAVSEFEQMQRISVVIAASRPSSAQKQVIQAYLRGYQPGQTVPADDNQQYVTPVVYGIALSGKLLNNLGSLSGVHMSGDNQQLFNKWKKIVDPPNLSEIYQRLTTAAQDQPQLSLRSMTRMQQELVAAQQAQVSYLVMPPGWGTDQLGKLNTQMGVQIATEQFEASKPDTNQALASITATQQQLQTKLDALEASHTETMTRLQTQIDGFKGTPDQLAQLKNDLAALGQAQTTTINNLQTQLTSIIDSHTKLGDSIENLRQEQLTNLTELELRASNHAQQLSDSTQAQLTASLNQIDSLSQTLIANLQSRVNGLDASQTQLRTELTGQIQTIQDDYSQLAAYTQAQIDAGAAATTQLQTDLQSTQTSLSQHAAQLASLSTSSSALSQLVNQVKTDSTNQANNLQGQINSLAISQQTTQIALSSLQDQQAADTAQLASQLASLSVLQAQAQAAITALDQQQTQAQSDINNLSTNFDTLQTAFDTSEQIQTTMQANIADQQSALDSLRDQTQSSIDTLTLQQTQLASQITNLANNVTTLSQTLSTVQTASTAAQTQLDTLLANPPWAIPSGTYVTQSQFDTLSSQIDAQFAAKSAALDAQFQTYQQTLNASVNQLNSQVQALNTTVNNTSTAQTQQQTQINSLSSQIQTLQTQVQQLLSASTPGGGL